jgi:hypothetical protein
MWTSMLLKFRLSSQFCPTMSSLVDNNVGIVKVKNNNTSRGAWRRGVTGARGAFIWTLDRLRHANIMATERSDTKFS